MLEKVFYTSVLVSDQDKALDFYTNVLGLEKRAENPTPDGCRANLRVRVSSAADRGATPQLRCRARRYRGARSRQRQARPGRWSVPPWRLAALS